MGILGAVVFPLSLPSSFSFSFFFLHSLGGRSPISQIFLPPPLPDPCPTGQVWNETASGPRAGQDTVGAARSAVRFRTRLDRINGRPVSNGSGRVSNSTATRTGWEPDPRAAGEKQLPRRRLFFIDRIPTRLPRGIPVGPKSEGGGGLTRVPVSPPPDSPKLRCSGRKRFGGHILCGGVHWNFGKVTLKRKTRISGLAFHPPGTFEPTCW